MSENANVLNPGESKKFVYVGNLIPCQVDIKNLSDNPATFTVVSGTSSWRVWWNVPPNETISIFVEWFDGIATFTNISVENASLAVGGDGIRPLQTASESSEITYSETMPEISAEPRTVNGAEWYQFVLQCYDAAGRVSYYYGWFDLDEKTRREIKAELYAKAQAEGCTDCACTLIN